VTFFITITDTRLKDNPEGSLRTRNSRESMDDSAGRSLEIDADERIGTATCGAWSSRVSVTRPPQSPCDAQTCHYHATLSTVGSTRTRTHNQCREHIRERALSSTHDQTAWSNGSQGTRVKGARRRTEGLQTRWSPPCRSTWTHPRHCVRRGNAVLEEVDPSFTERFNRPQVRRPLTPTLSPNSLIRSLACCKCRMLFATSRT